MNTNSPTRVEYLAELCAAFIEENKEAFIEQYPKTEAIVEDLFVPNNWIRTTKRNATSEEQQIHKHATTVYLYTYKGKDILVESLVFTFGISVVGLCITVVGE